MDAFDIGLTCLIFSFAAIVAFGFLYFLTWLIFGRSSYSLEKTVTARVVGTSFHPEQTTVSVASFAGARCGTAVVTQHHDEEDIVLLRSKETGRISINNADLLDCVKHDEDVELTYKEKYFFWTWSRENRTFEEYVPTKVRVQDGTEIDL
jgi:hypothetical protein